MQRSSSHPDVMGGLDANADVRDRAPTSDNAGAPGHVSCRTTCAHTYPAGAVVAVTATPDPGWKFGHWLGACTGSGLCNPTMNQDKGVTAVFVPVTMYTLTVLTDLGSGDGTVTGDGIACKPTCSHDYPEETNVVLTPTAATGSRFDHWEGPCPLTGVCVVRMNADKDVTAIFRSLPALTVAAKRPGSVNACRGRCTTLHERNSIATAAATPDPGYVLVGWREDCATRTGKLCDLAMDGDKVAVAVFQKVTFEWSMPARYDGSDRNGDGLADYFTPANYTRFRPWPDLEGSLIAPRRWSLDRKASTCPVGLRWLVDGVPTETACEGAFLLAEGDHTLTLTANGDVADTQVVTVKDWLIAAIGDSYGSGEGNPDVPRGGAIPGLHRPSRWEHKQCHRSATAAAALAAARVEAADTHSSVTLVHLSCSGATILTGLLGPYNGAAPDASAANPEPPQVTQLQRAIPGRTPDALLISIGGNDIGFADIITNCLVFKGCDTNAQRCLPKRLFRPGFRSVLNSLIFHVHRCAPSARQIFDRGMRRLPGRFPGWPRGSTGFPTVG